MPPRWGQSPTSTTALLLRSVSGSWSVWAVSGLRLGLGCGLGVAWVWAWVWWLWVCNCAYCAVVALVSRRHVADSPQVCSKSGYFLHRNGGVNGEVGFSVTSNNLYIKGLAVFSNGLLSRRSWVRAPALSFVARLSSLGSRGTRDEHYGPETIAFKIANCKSNTFHNSLLGTTSPVTPI